MAFCRFNFLFLPSPAYSQLPSPFWWLQSHVKHCARSGWAHGIHLRPHGLFTQPEHIELTIIIINSLYTLLECDWNASKEYLIIHFELGNGVSFFFAFFRDPFLPFCSPCLLFRCRFSIIRNLCRSSMNLAGDDRNRSALNRAPKPGGWTAQTKAPTSFRCKELIYSIMHLFIRII